MAKKPFFMCMDMGQVGTFIRTRPSLTGQGLVDVEFKPFGLFKRNRFVRNVPESSLTKVLHPPAHDSDGIESDGYVIAIVGSHGSAWMANELKLDVENKIKTMQNQLIRSEISDKVKEQQLKVLSKGHEETLKQIKEAQDTISRKERRMFDPDWADYS